jgi:hypothetical protein
MSKELHGVGREDVLGLKGGPSELAEPRLLPGWLVGLKEAISAIVDRLSSNGESLDVLCFEVLV